MTFPVRGPTIHHVTLIAALTSRPRSISMPAATWAVGGLPGRQLVQPGDARTLSTLPLVYLDVASPLWVARRIGLVACPAPDTFGSADTRSL